jgi:hypothetical protein
MLICMSGHRDWAYWKNILCRVKDDCLCSYFADYVTERNIFRTEAAHSIQARISFLGLSFLLNGTDFKTFKPSCIYWIHYLQFITRPWKHIRGKGKPLKSSWLQPTIRSDFLCPSKMVFNSNWFWSTYRAIYICIWRRDSWKGQLARW